MSNVERIGTFSQTIINVLNLKIPCNTPIYIGQQNRDHMNAKHPHDYYYYGHLIPDIIKTPDYVGIESKNNSIEYIKEVSIDPDVTMKLAIRVSTNGKYFVKTLYNIPNLKVSRALTKGYLIDVRNLK